MRHPFRVLFIGDIVGEVAVDLLEKFLPGFLKQESIDFCIANGENASGGRGIAESLAKRLFSSGVDVLTGGDHSFDRNFDFAYMRQEKRLLRPLNYPRGNPGQGMGIYTANSGLKLAVLNLRGQAYFQNPIECPFRNADWAIPKLLEETSVIFVDFHAEATAEKRAMGWHLDGRVTAMLGTHTHIQTADEQILPQGTAYITDVGFTGPQQSVIGMDIQQALNRAILQTPHKFILADRDYRLNGVILELTPETGKVDRIQRVSVSIEG